MAQAAFPVAVHARSAQSADVPPPETELPSLEGSALDGDFLSVGIGIGIGPDYIGSDDYTLVPLPLVQGSIGGIDVNPRPAGFALDFVDDNDKRVSFQFGPELKLNFNRAIKVDDELVEAFPELDIAVEVGPTIGVNIDRVITPVDSVNLNVDILFDVAGAHSGMSVRPTLTYFTPLSRSTAVTLSGHATWADDDFADYYFTVDPTLAPGTPLPAFTADSGFIDTGVTLLGALDLNGDLLDGGFAIFGIANYTRVLGDAADTPFTDITGSADQFFGGVGIGYTF
ncbi:MipA/OmpV family protein [Erythrobacter sp.]|jgi:outer membrane scaffolding protein for murein synthesis (MipA/OmpV family)|uniref:MipA/OmpV family protein n=1 Tax=Erythrobacter sp. TaxID=1042 RepID=UPI002EB25C22|nr:MipA/OmpV family protein [Erythrobacter sp.]